jgi:hypothetical protein
MYTSLYELGEPAPGVTRYLISDDGRVSLTLPDLMRIRFYIQGCHFFVGFGIFLPKIYERIEFDIRTNEWYIIREVY